MRHETDLLGTREVPAESYWGIHTLRALENFPKTGPAIHPALVAALAHVKKACAIANAELGFLDQTKAAAISQAAEEVASGQFSDQFPVDALQGGAGTSTNMNVNEVLANRASEILGGPRGGDAFVHPINDLNLHQSTNDVCPTALKVAAIRGIRALSDSISKLHGAFQRKEKEFASVVKMGRTELQEAVPMTLGMEFSAFAEAIGRDHLRCSKSEERLRVVNLGGTAIGTGITAPSDYILVATDHLCELTGLPLVRGENLVSETANTDPIVEVSGILKAHATNLLKITSDLRLLNLLGEVRLQPLQAGSSIMPGKVNPVMMEMTAQVALKVMANDYLMSEGASRAHLQLNEFFPLMAQALLESIDILIAIDERLVTHIDAAQADAERCMRYVIESPTLATILLPRIGYPAATALVKQFVAEKSGKSFISFLEEKFGKEIADSAVDPAQVAMLGFESEPK